VSADLLALVIGTVLAVGALAFVLAPLFIGGAADTAAASAPAGAGEDSAIQTLREIEFDRATGKLSESDYAELKATWSARALAEMRAAGSGAADPGAATGDAPLDPVEARVRAYRLGRKECPTCGLRPEPDAIYCSTCGGYLDRACPSCQAPVAEAGAAFCSRCGTTLARLRAIA
jgi:hypothetical protein